MGKRASLTTQEYLLTATLPAATETYTVIPHGSIIDKVKTALGAKGFEIERELYRCNQGAQIAQGVYHINYGGDPDMGMMFAWSNSYDKTMKFKCAIGGYIHNSLSSIIPYNTAKWDRKHTGTADNEAFDMIDHQINQANEYFQALVSDKEIMKKVSITEEKRAHIMGVLYFVNELLTSEQLSTVRNQFAKPSFPCTGSEGTVWETYNAIAFALQQSHPKNWMDQQKMIHLFLSTYAMLKDKDNSAENNYPVEKPVVDPNQLDLLEEISKAEKGKIEDKAPVEIETPIESPVIETPEPFVTKAEEPITEVNFSVGGRPTVMEFIATPTEESVVVTDDVIWECLGCGKPQGIQDAFHDGQLCTSCNNMKADL